MSRLSRETVSSASPRNTRLLVNQAGADGFRDGAATGFSVADDRGQSARPVVTRPENELVRLRLETGAKLLATERFGHAVVFAELERLIDDQRARR